MPPILTAKWQASANIEKRSFRTLVDECVTPHVVTPVYAAHFGWATHMNDLEKSGMKDPKVINLASSYGCDIILTRDTNQGQKGDALFDSQHLTVRAVAKSVKIMEKYEQENGQQTTKPWHADKLTTMPKLIHVNMIANDPEKIMSLLRQNEKYIFMHAMYAISPYIAVTPSGVMWGPSFKRLHQDFSQDAQEYSIEDNITARARKLARRIIKENPQKYSDETEQSLLERKAKLWVKKMDAPQIA